MPALTSGQLDLLRADGHKAKFYLSISHPPTLLTAAVNNGSAARGDQSIPYDGGSGSGFSTIAGGQVLRVATATGEKRIRLRSISGSQSSGTITVAANSILWNNNQGFDILEDYPPDPRPPRFTTSTLYKDWDITYTDENEMPPPVIIAGPHRAKFLSGSSQAVFDIDLSGSYAVAAGAAMASYAVAVSPASGVTVSVDSGTGIGTITFTATGEYWVKFTGTDDNGKSQMTYRRFWVHDPDGADYYPYTDLTIDTLSGDWERGGWSLDITVHGVADTDTFPDEALVCLWYTVTYGDTEEYIGGPAGAEQVLFCGYIRQGTVAADWKHSTVQLEAETIQALLRNISMRDVVLEAVENPTKWYQYAASLTTGRALHHYWRYHAFLFECCDVLGLFDDLTTLRAVANFQKGDLYGQAESVAREFGINAHIVCNKAGQIHLVQDIQLLPDADRAAATVTCKLAGEDRHGQITLIDRPYLEAAMAFANGFVFAGTFTDGVPDVDVYCAKAPGSVPEISGTTFIDKPNQIIASQAHLNQITGRFLAAANNQEPEAQINFNGIWAGVLDIVGDEWFQMDMAAADNARGIVWTDRFLVCRRVANRVDPVNSYIASEATLEPEAQGPVGVTDSCGSFPVAGEPEEPEWDQDSVCDSLHVAIAATEFEADTVSMLDIAQLTSTKFVVSYQNTVDSLGYVVILEISGSTIQVGTPVSIGENIFGVSVAALDDGHFILAFKGDFPFQRGRSVAGSVSGTTITLGAVDTFEAGEIDEALWVEALSSSKAIVCYHDLDDSGKIKGAVLDISDVTVTSNSPVVIDNNACTAICAGCSLTAIDDSTVLLAYPGNDTGDLNAVILSSITTTFTVNTPATVSASLVEAPCVRAVSTSAVACMFQHNLTDTKCAILSVSGVTVTPNVPITLSTLASTYAKSRNLAVLRSSRLVAIYDEFATPVIVGGTSLGAGTELDTGYAALTGLLATVEVNENQVMVVFGDASASDRGMAAVVECS